VKALRVGVVGAGIAGLAAAHAIRRLAAEGGRALELEVMEAGERAGGQLQTVVEDGFVVEWAANAFRTGVGPTADLVARLGLEGERVVASPAANRRFVFHGGRLHPLPSGPAGLLRFAPDVAGGPLAGVRGALRRTAGGARGVGARLRGAPHRARGGRAVARHTRARRLRRRRAAALRRRGVPGHA
jgi:protoporphyrinogen oxidase